MVRPSKRSQRKLTTVKAQMRVGEEWAPVLIGNVSATGMMVKYQDPPPVGTQIEIRHRSVEIHGEVMWTTRTRFGLRSLGEMDLDALLAESGLERRSANVNVPDRQPRWWHWRR